MTLILLKILQESRFSLHRSKLIYLFLILIAMLKPISAAPQVAAYFTTNSTNEGCGSLVVEFQDLSIGDPQTWLWDFGNGNTSTEKNPTTIYSSAGLYDVSLTVSNNLSSDSILEISYIKVYQNPVASINMNTSPQACLPFNVAFSDISTYSAPIISWQWDFGDGGVSSQQHPIYTYTNTGYYSVSLSVIDANSCQDLVIDNNIIELYNVPIANFDTDISFSCNSSELVSFTNTSLNGIDYLWNFGDGSTSVLENPSHLFLEGVYTVSLIVSSGTCSDTIIMTDLINIGSTLSPEIIASSNNICQNSTIDFTDLTLNNPDTWMWNFGDGNTSNVQNPSHTYLNPGFYNVTLNTSISGNCSNSITIPAFIEVFSKPAIDFRADTTYSCIPPLNVQFSDNTIDAVSWEWSFGNGSMSSNVNPIVSFSNYGVFDIQLRVIDSNGCIENKTIDSMIVVEDIVIDFSSDISSGCLPLSTTFNDLTNSIRPIVNWHWNFGDGTNSNLQNPLHQYMSAGTYDVSLMLVNDYGCASSLVLDDYISVDEYALIDFFSGPIISCPEEDIIFSNLLSYNTPITYWYWDFGDGTTSNLQTPTYQYQFSGTYDVTLVAGNSCKDTFFLSNYIEILSPTSDFEEVYNCENPYSVDFINQSIGADNVFWDFGDGSSSTSFNPTHIFTNRGDYYVSLTTTNNSTGCVDELIKRITITEPIADFSYLTDDNNSPKDSVGCVPYQVHLENNSQDYHFYKVLWSDGYISYDRVDHFFNSTGVFDVSMIVVDIHSCKDTMVIENMYRVNDVTADFEIANILGCDSMLVEFINLTSPISSAKWDFGDGGNSLLNNPEHIYYNEGFFDVTLFVKSDDGCKDTLERIEYVKFQYPTANLSTVSQSICPFDDVQFTNLSDGIGLFSSWDFGDGSQSNSNDPLHNFSSNGFYDISLNIVDSFGCSSSLVLPEYISVLKPTAKFSVTDLVSNCPPIMSSFINQSSLDVISWSWDFGDGGVSTISDPFHLFSDSGLFDVSLIVENSFGCKDTLIENGYINMLGAMPSGTFMVSDTLICKYDSVLFIPSVSNANYFIWDFGNGILSNDSVVSGKYNHAGVFMPSLIIENSSGCQLSISSLVEIYVSEVVVDAGADLEICEGESVQLNAVGNSSYYSWTPNNNLSLIDVNNPYASPTTSSFYFVNHTDGLCSAFDSVFVKVYNDIPNATFISENFCNGDTTSFIANSGLNTNNISFMWNFGHNGQIVDAVLNLGENNIMLVIENLDNSCKDTLEQNIYIYENPNANFLLNDVCLGDTVDIIDNSYGSIDFWNYTFGDGLDFSLDQNPSYTYINAGVYYITLNITSDMGCTDSIVKEVTIHELPLVDFTIENNCEGVGNVFTDLSTAINSDILSIEYDFNEEFISNDSVSNFVFSGYGLFDVELTVTSVDGCINSKVKTTEVFPNPIVDFSVSELCFGEQTIFNNMSFVPNSKIVSYDWILGSEGFSSAQDTKHIFSSSGIYDVSLIVYSDRGCESMLNKKVAIYELPLPKFKLNSDVCLGDEVEISSLSDSNIAEWHYNFGDGNFSNEQNPNHRYEYLSTFDISLEVVSFEGCKNDTTMFSIVETHALPIANFNLSSLSVSELSPEISFYNISEGATSFVWDFDNGDYSFEENPTYSFSKARIYNVELTVSDNFGCISNIIKTVHVSPEFTFYIPESFTPNDDGINDVFFAYGDRFSSYQMKIFDRWGGIVFSSNSNDYGWDGLDTGDREVIEGSYFYNISLYDYNGRLWVYNGELNLFR